MNFLLITADDLEWTSVGAYGSAVDGITPNIDGLASEGLRFTNGYVTIAEWETYARETGLVLPDYDAAYAH